jgi:PAS domain S-box-containing protein
MPGRKSKGIKHQSKARKSVSGKKVPKKKISASTISVNIKTHTLLKECERQLKIVLDAAQMGIWEWDIRTNHLNWTGSFFDIYKPDRNSFSHSYESYMKLVHPEDHDRVIEGLEKSLKEHTIYHDEYRIIRTDGTMRWVESVGNITRNKKGAPIRMAGIVQDITSKKLAEKESEEWKVRHEMISTSAGLVIYDYNIPSGDILWSGNSIEVLGYKPGELGNIDRWVDLIHPDDREEAFRLLQLAQDNVQPYDVYYRFSRKDGNYCYMHDRGFFVANDKGVAVRMLGMMNDVTERIQAEERLRDSEQRFRTLQEASFGGIGLHDHGVIIDCNQGLCDLSGYSYEELIGSNGLDLIAPEWRDFVLEKIRLGYDKTYDAEGIRKDGTRYFLEIRGKNMPYESRAIRVTEFRDISERKRHEEKIIEQNTRLLAVTDDLRRKNNQLEEFTQIVSHNLRSPVGNILTLLNFYDSAQADAEKNEYITLIKEAGATTLTMLNELNDILKIRQTKNIEKQELKFEHVLQQIRSMVNARITELSARITHDFSEAPVIHYPAIYMESILLNLLDNALKYHSPQRQPVITIRTYYNENRSLIMEVRDNGLGINMERFGHQVFKLRKTFHHHPESRGIGLFMIKNQIEAMGGEISISSKENEGSAFFINFNKHPTDGP